MNQASRILAAALLIGAPAVALGPAAAVAQTTTPAQTDTSTPPPPPPPAQIISTSPDFPRGKISGYFYVDYYYNVAGDPRHAYNASGQDSGKTYIDGSPTIGRDLNGFQIRRVYFQHDADITAKFSTRFRLEVDSKSLTSDGKLGAAVKAAFGQVKNAVPHGSFFFGVLPTPIFENSEEFWAYRSIEKTLLDFRGIGSSADIGVELKGSVDANKKIGYTAMIGNGPGQKPEDNRYKKFYLSLPLLPMENLRVEPYVDYEAVAGNNDKATYKLFTGYELKHGAIGGEIVDRVNHKTGVPNQEPFGFSVFGRYMPHEKLGAVVRFDRWQPDTKAANRLDTDMWIAGVDWQPSKDIHFIPNIEATQYHARGTTAAPAHHDLQARLTMYWKFSKP